MQLQNEYITVREFEQRLEALERSMKRSNSEIITKALKKHDMIEKNLTQCQSTETKCWEIEHRTPGTRPSFFGNHGVKITFSYLFNTVLTLTMGIQIFRWPWLPCPIKS